MVLSPHFDPGTTWFGADKSKLTRKITRIFTNKFDQPYYNRSCVPIPKRDKYFLKFAKEHTWHPSHTGRVQARFEQTCQARLKDIVSKAGSKRKKPRWIDGDLWKLMCTHWDTEEAREKSATTRATRMSNRNGKGSHKHVSGQKSFLQVEQELEVELGRPPTIIKVFLKTHTKKDGSFVDKREHEVFERYKCTKEAKLDELTTDECADGSSRQVELSLEQDNEIFFQSIITNTRGQVFGLGSLGNYINGKRKYSGSSSSFSTLQQQLEEAHRRLDEQASLQAERDEEHVRITSAFQEEIQQMKSFFIEQNPAFRDFLIAKSNENNPVAP